MYAPATDMPASDTPATDTPASDTPATDTPASDTPATNTPTPGVADATASTTTEGEYYRVARAWNAVSSSSSLESEEARAAADADAPERVEGELWKRSPRSVPHAKYQLRRFILDNGTLCYYSGKGEPKLLHVVDVDRLEMSERTLEFSIVFTAVDRAVTSHTTFSFKAPSLATFKTWTDGLREHCEYEQRLQVEDGPNRSSDAGAPLLRNLSGVLCMQRTPFQWARYNFTRVGELLLYHQEGGGWQRAIPLHSTTSIAITDENRCQFDLITPAHTYRLRAPDSAQLYRWINALNYIMMHRYSHQTPAGHAMLRRGRDVSGRITTSQKCGPMSSVGVSDAHEDTMPSWDSSMWEVLNAAPIGGQKLLQSQRASARASAVDRRASSAAGAQRGWI